MNRQMKRTSAPDRSRERPPELPLGMAPWARPFSTGPNVTGSTAEAIRALAVVVMLTSASCVASSAAGPQSNRRATAPSRAAGSATQGDLALKLVPFARGLSQPTAVVASTSAGDRRRLQLPIAGEAAEWLRAVRRGEVAFEEWWDRCLALDGQLERSDLALRSSTPDASCRPLTWSPPHIWAQRSAMRAALPGACPPARRRGWAGCRSHGSERHAQSSRPSGPGPW